MEHHTSQTGFYEDLPPFDDFGRCTDPSVYRPLPQDWHLAVADIQGSAAAIAEGRYKDVNMLGAAAITAVLNALKTCDPVPDVPYVFGGDGATIAVPAYAVDAARGALAATKSLSENRFGMPMRAALVPVADIRAMNRDIQVAKFRLSHGNHLAFFNGGGCSFVDALIKDREIGAAYRIETAGPDAFPDLDGLSCRWSMVRGFKGQVVSLIVQVTDEAPVTQAQLFQYVLASLRRALKVDLSDCSPASDEALRFRWPPVSVMTEARTTAGPGGLPVAKRAAFVLLQSAIQWLLHKTGKEAGGYDAPVYQREMIANTDFRRFDDTLRLVLDCTDEQVAALKAQLEAMQRAGDIVYGMHLSDTALMTCMVFDLARSGHVHFIDGADGGLTVAAQKLKRQLARGS